MLINNFTERKLGVLETTSSFPIEIGSWMEDLNVYQKNCDKSLCRICFTHSSDQHMLMMAKPSHYTMPHYQEGRQVEYHFYKGSAELYLFSKSGDPDSYILLSQGDTITLDTSRPRAMCVGSEGAVFKETFTGDFSDRYTHWPFGKSVNAFSVNKIRHMFQGVI